MVCRGGPVIDGRAGLLGALVTPVAEWARVGAGGEVVDAVAGVVEHVGGGPGVEDPDGVSVVLADEAGGGVPDVPHSAVSWVSRGIPPTTQSPTPRQASASSLRPLHKR